MGLRKLFRRWYRSWLSESRRNRPVAPKILVHPGRPTVCRTPGKPEPKPAPPARSDMAPLVVRPDVRPLWETKKWQKKKKTLFGTYKTALGSFGGKIVLNKSIPEYFILEPPRELLNGPHRECFRPRDGGWYWVHFHSTSADVDSGIVAIEGCLYDALSRRG